MANHPAGLIFRPLVIAAMVTCIAAGWVGAMEAALGGVWHGGYLLWIVPLVTLETLLAQGLERRHRLALYETWPWAVRAAEGGMILILVKVASYASLGRGWDQLPQDVALWLREPESFFDLGFVLGSFITGALWIMSMGIAGDIAEIEDENGSMGDPESARASLQDQFVWGAFVLLASLGAKRLQFAPGAWGLRPVELGELALLPIIYVGLGLVLFGQMRLALLLAGWARQQVPVAPGLEQRWSIWSVLFVALISALVLLLPAGNTSIGVYLLTVLALFVLFAGQLLAFLLYLILGLVLLPCAILFRPSSSSFPGPPPLPNFPRPPETGATPEWLFPLQAVLLGTLLLLLLFLIVRTYWRDRRAYGIWRAIWDGTRALWAWILAWLKGHRQFLDEVWRRNHIGEEGAARLPGLANWERWRARTTRERVRRLYLALVERAGQAGHARHPAQTPIEFSSDLQRHVEDNQALAELTEAFVLARYSRRTFPGNEVSRLHRLWQRLRSELRRL